ncbi:MAG: winged helix-turn-helix domain-containing protein [Paracoccaceae bacterium]
MLRLNEGRPEALRTRKAPGKSPILTDERRQELAAAVEAGPKPCLDGVGRWRLIDLVEWVRDEFGVTVSRATLGRELRAMGFRKFSARPQHYAPDPGAIEAFKKLPRHGPRHPHPERLAAGRDLVPGVRHADRHRSEAHGGRAGRAEEQDHPPLGGPIVPARAAFARRSRPCANLALRSAIQACGSKGTLTRPPRHHPGCARWCRMLVRVGCF